MGSTYRSAVWLATSLLVATAAYPAVASPGEPRDSELVGPVVLAGSSDEIVAPQSSTISSRASINDPLFDLQWYLRAIRAPQAWALTTGSPEVTVAVIDTGVDPAHQDLDGALWVDPATGSFGLDLVGGTGTPYRSANSDWHGTALAGVLAARAGDGYGMAGVAPDTSVMVMRIYTSPSHTEPPVLEGGYDLAVDGINEAVDRGADVILLAWGGQDDSPQLREAIEDAGVPVVVAAGNDAVDLSASGAPLERYPAMYRLPNLITVGASDLDDGVWSVDAQVGSNVGVRHVDIAAPGELIVGPMANAAHRYNSGTSFAAPQVAGALALAVAIAPRADASELVGELSRTARAVPAFNGRVTSGGILDVEAFLTAVQRPVCNGDVPLANYVDVADDSTHAAGIGCITAFELAEGVGDERFAPMRSVTRGQMATFLTRLLTRAGAIEPGAVTAPAPGEATFTDTAGTTHAAAIEVVSQRGIARGFADGSFRPNQPVTRGQMASLLVGAIAELTARDYDSGRNWFDDVQATTHEDSILAARELGITLGTAAPRSFEPRRVLTRGQMASLLARSLDAASREGVVLAPAG